MTFVSLSAVPPYHVALQERKSPSNGEFRLAGASAERLGDLGGTSEHEADQEAGDGGCHRRAGGAAVAGTASAAVPNASSNGGSYNHAGDGDAGFFAEYHFADNNL